MKRVLCIPLFAAFCAAALFAADRIYCKWCGSPNFANVRQMTASPCAKSPSGRHELYGGAPRQFYVCIYCGFESASFEQLVTSPCSRSPRRCHDAYEGTVKASYACKNCGFESRSFRQLVLSPCRASPRGCHEVR